MVAFIHKEKPHSARQDQAFRWLDSFVALHVTGAVKLVDDAGIHRGVGLRARRRFFLKQACDFRSFAQRGFAIPVFFDSEQNPASRYQVAHRFREVALSLLGD